MPATALNITYILLSFAAITGMYFRNLLRSQEGSRVAMEKKSCRETEKLKKMRQISSSQPLSELTRPGNLGEILGQSEGIKALRAAPCGPHPQHVIVYGPRCGQDCCRAPGAGGGQQNPASPFGKDAKSVKIDASAARFDEPGIANPLTGPVHDPSYQDAGPPGVAGVSQPKPGAVAWAHWGHAVH